MQPPEGHHFAVSPHAGIDDAFRMQAAEAAKASASADSSTDTEEDVEEEEEEQDSDELHAEL